MLTEYRIAFQLHIIKAEQRHDYSQPCAVKMLPTTELQAFGVFDSFNYPRPPNNAYTVTSAGEIVSSWQCPPINFIEPDPSE